MATPTGTLLQTYQQPSAFNARRRVRVWLFFVALLIFAFIFGSALPGVICLGLAMLGGIGLVGIIMDWDRAQGGKRLDVYADGYRIKSEAGKTVSESTWANLASSELTLPSRNSRTRSSHDVGQFIVGLALDAMSDALADKEKERYNQARTDGNLEAFTLNLKPKDGKPTEITKSMPNFLNAVATMTHAYYQAERQNRLQAAGADQLLTFGPAEIRLASLRIGRRECNWSDLVAVEVQNGCMEFKRRDPKTGQPVHFAYLGPALDRLILIDIVKQFAPNALRNSN